MAYAKVINGIVTTVSTKPIDKAYVICGNAVKAGWLFSNNTFTPSASTQYNITNWYWAVAGSTTQVYSSSQVAYVPLTNSDYVAWKVLGNAPTPISSEAELISLFAQAYVAGWPPTVSQQAQAAATSALTAGLIITSTGTPTLNGTYSLSQDSQNNINAVVTYILLNSTFPGGGTTMAWADAAGIAHVFPSTTEFKAFATAIANFVAAVSIYGDSSGTQGSIPTNQVTIA